MANTLTPGELLDLTGTPQPKRQAAVLRDYGLNPLVRSDGSVCITWEAVNAAMRGTAPPRLDFVGVNLDVLGHG